jgi:Gpi18-like mannosyltransferase
MAVDAAPTRREWTWLVAAVAVATVVELIMAATALGTEDVRRWSEFAVGINDVGPWRVYGIAFETSYNHPPATGAFLWLIGGLADQLRTFAFVLRPPAIAASAVTPFVVFALLRPRSPGVALPAAVSVALSPALIAIAGFHGNTDPVVVMLALLSVYLLVDRRAPAWSGTVIALAIGVKIVPVVVVPVLVLAAWHADRRSARRLLVGAGVTSLII